MVPYSRGPGLKMTCPIGNSSASRTRFRTRQPLSHVKIKPNTELLLQRIARTIARGLGAQSQCPWDLYPYRGKIPTTRPFRSMPDEPATKGVHLISISLPILWQTNIDNVMAYSLPGPRLNDTMPPYGDAGKSRGRSENRRPRELLSFLAPFGNKIASVPRLTCPISCELTMAGAVRKIKTRRVDLSIRDLARGEVT